MSTHGRPLSFLVGEDPFASLAKHDAARLERDAIDAYRCLLRPGEAPAGDGALLLRWRALSSSEKRAHVERWTLPSFQLRGYRVIPGAPWPTSTFDEPPIACGLYGFGDVVCMKPRGHERRGDEAHDFAPA